VRGARLMRFFTSAWLISGAQCMSVSDLIQADGSGSGT
jgi:hypothetical protein